MIDRLFDLLTDRLFDSSTFWLFVGVDCLVDGWFCFSFGYLCVVVVGGVFFGLIFVGLRVSVCARACVCFGAHPTPL